MQRIVSVLMVLAVLTSCYQQQSLTPDAWDLTERQMDSISFYTTHHYTQNYNFYMKADSLSLVAQDPTELDLLAKADTLTVGHGDLLVVAAIVNVPSDTIDSTWVKVARDQYTMGWVREAELLKAVAPDDPISQFIDFFSDTHLLIALAIFVLVSAAYALLKLLKRKAKLVHVNDIDSFYPSLLCLLVASSAVFYSTIQLVAPEAWRHFYYHPSLNPFALPPLLGCFVLLVWSLLIVGIAAFEDVRRQLWPTEALFYFVGLAGVCAVDYIVFSVSTLYYVGYPLLAVYVAVAVRQYLRKSHARYACGSCGKPLHHKGCCPHCGVLNE